MTILKSGGARDHFPPSKGTAILCRNSRDLADTPTKNKKTDQARLARRVILKNDGGKEHAIAPTQSVGPPRAAFLQLPDLIELLHPREDCRDVFFQREENE